MFPWIDLIATLGGLIVAPTYDFIKKKFIKEENDTPERTMGSLASTKPEVLPEYIKALSDYFKSQTDYFNRDVCGEVDLWVRDARAIIRPITVVGSLFILGVIAVSVIFFDYVPTGDSEIVLAGVRVSCEANVSSWMGSRFSLKN